MTETYDVTVLGLGGMGSAALAHAARRNARVVGFDRHPRGHARGSSTGESRIIRKAYFEDAAYVPLLLRAYELWAELEATTGTTLRDLRGMLMVGSSESEVLRGALAAARRHGILVDELERGEVLRRYPSLRLLDDERGIFERDAGTVFPELAIAAHLDAAENAGAETHFSTPVAGYASEAGGIVVSLGDGSHIRTARLVICAGPWLGEIARELALPLEVQRNVQLWFEPTTPAYDGERFPVFFLDRPGLPAPLYGFPDRGGGVKAALHAYGETTTAETLDREIHPSDVTPVRAALDAFLPGAAGAYAAGKACTYTLTPDRHFIIDTHPADDRIVIAGGFSGHGFKFCSVVGEILADLASDGTTRRPIDFLRLRRFAER